MIFALKIYVNSDISTLSHSVEGFKYHRIIDKSLLLSFINILKQNVKS